MDQPPPPSSIPPPDLPKPPAMPSPAPAAPPVKIRIRQPGDPVDGLAEADRAAPFNTRVLAMLIDLGVAAALFLAAWLALPFWGDRLGLLIALAYLLTRDALPVFGGRSVGKVAMRLKVMTWDDKEITGNWEAALVRNGVLLIPFFALVEIFVLLTREDQPGRGTRLGDEWAKTRVVTTPEPAPPDSSS